MGSRGEVRPLTESLGYHSRVNEAPSSGQSGIAKRTRSDLLELLAENQAFLRRSSEAFDEGFESEAKRLAVVLRLLLHDTSRSHSLLYQLGIKDRLDFLDTRGTLDSKNQLPTLGLVTVRFSSAPSGLVIDYAAPLAMGRTEGKTPLGFDPWWHEPVMEVDGTWSRRQLVLTLANQEGGAHVDSSLNDRYDALARRNATGWDVTNSTSQTFVNGNVVGVSVRQIAFEVLETLSTGTALLSMQAPQDGEV